MEVVFQVQNLEKKFSTQFLKSKAVLRQVSFKVLKGTSVGFIGANGSGKTTTIKCILNFIFPDQGQIEYFGQNQFSDQIKRKIGFVSERPYLPDFMTVEEFLLYHWKLSGQSMQGFAKRSQQLLAQVRLSDAKDRALKAFSKGMQQRAAIAQALLLEPELIILDEPMSGLDPDGRLIVKDIIRLERAKGKTIFFSSHLLADMDELCSHIIMMENGQVVFQGTIDEFSTGVDQNYIFVYKNPAGELKTETVLKSDFALAMQKAIEGRNEIISIQKTDHSVEAAYARYRKEKLK